MLGKWIQQITLTQLEKNVKINNTIINIDDIDVNNLQVI